MDTVLEPQFVQEESLKGGRLRGLECAWTDALLEPCRTASSWASSMLVDPVCSWEEEDDEDDDDFGDEDDDDFDDDEDFDDDFFDDDEDDDDEDLDEDFEEDDE